jgi:hypothetical protein
MSEGWPTLPHIPPTSTSPSSQDATYKRIAWVRQLDLVSLGGSAAQRHQIELLPLEGAQHTDGCTPRGAFIARENWLCYSGPLCNLRLDGGMAAFETRGVG